MDKIEFTISDESIPEKVSDRAAIFLDTNVWINLADESGDAAKIVKAKLRELVTQGKVFCPLSFALLDELLKQNYGSALRVASLMEELNLNISFIIEKEIYNQEIDDFVRSLIENTNPGLSKKDIYLPVLGFLASYGSIVFPEEFPGTDEQRLGFVNQISQLMKTYKLTDIITAFKNNLPFPQEQFATLIKHSEVWRERWDATKGNKKKMHRIEEEHVALEILFPRLVEQSNKLSEDQKLKYFRAMLEIPKDTYGGAAGTILNGMPALRTTIEVMTITGCDPNRNADLNDVMDIQMMITPLAYADVFVSQDKWIRDLLLNRSSIVETNGVRYISNLTDFGLYLNTL